MSFISGTTIGNEWNYLLETAEHTAQGSIYMTSDPAQIEKMEGMVRDHFRMKPFSKENQTQFRVAMARLMSKPLVQASFEKIKTAQETVKKAGKAIVKNGKKKLIIAAVTLLVLMSMSNLYASSPAIKNFEISSIPTASVGQELPKSQDVIEVEKMAGVEIRHVDEWAREFMDKVNLDVFSSGSVEVKGGIANQTSTTTVGDVKYSKTESNGVLVAYSEERLSDGTIAGFMVDGKETRHVFVDADSLHFETVCDGQNASTYCYAEIDGKKVQIVYSENLSKQNSFAQLGTAKEAESGGTEVHVSTINKIAEYNKDDTM